MLRFRSENCKQVRRHSMLRQRAFCDLQPKSKHFSPQVLEYVLFTRLFLR